MTYPAFTWKWKIKSIRSHSILLESLVALGLFAMITTLLLGKSAVRARTFLDFKGVGSLVGPPKWRFRLRKNHLENNGIQVQVRKDGSQLTVLSSRKVVLHVE